jgi:hypothetical protein
MVSKHSKLAKKQTQDHYGRFASSSIRTASSPSCHEVESSSHCHTAPPPSRHEEASSNDSVEMWVVRYTAPPPLRLVTPPPPARLVTLPPPPTHLEEVSSNDSLLSASSGYNDQCTCSFQIKKLEKKLTVAEKELQQARKDNHALARYINT